MRPRPAGAPASARERRKCQHQIFKPNRAGEEESGGTICLRVGTQSCTLPRDSHYNAMQIRSFREINCSATFLLSSFLCHQLRGHTAALVCLTLHASEQK